MSRDGYAARAADPAAWIAALFLASVLLQRLAVPHTPVPLLLPVIYAWVAAGLARGVLTLDRTRSLLALAAVVATASASVIGSATGHAPIASITSCALLLVTWAPLAATAPAADVAGYLRLLRHVARIGVGLAVACLAMSGLQLAGMPHVDVLADVLPPSMLLGDFNTNASTGYGSDVVKANAWIGLEPSIVSLLLGVALLAAVLSRRSRVVPVVLAAGMAATMSGSGIVLVAVGLASIAASRLHSLILRLALPGAALVAVVGFLPVGDVLLARSGEFSDPGSSGSIRAVEPYTHLLPAWGARLDGLLVGLGPGSSQALVDAPGIPGLIVPMPAKVFVDYGLIAGAVLAAFLVSGHLRAPSRSMALALFVAYWSIQPATTLVVLVVQIGMFCAFWSPATAALEGRAPTAPPARAPAPAAATPGIPRPRTGGAVPPRIPAGSRRGC